MKDLQIVVDVKNGEVKLIIGNETLMIDDFITDSEGAQVKVINEFGQKKILRLLMRNILN